MYRICMWGTALLAIGIHMALHVYQHRTVSLLLELMPGVVILTFPAGSSEGLNPRIHSPGERLP